MVAGSFIILAISEVARLIIVRHLGRFRRAVEGVYSAIFGGFRKIVDLSFLAPLPGFPER